MGVVLSDDDPENIAKTNCVRNAILWLSPIDELVNSMTIFNSELNQ